MLCAIMRLGPGAGNVRAGGAQGTLEQLLHQVSFLRKVPTELRNHKDNRTWHARRLQ